MQTNLRWGKKIFSNLYKIYSNGQQIGKLKENCFSKTAIGILNGQEYIFRTKGFFKQHTEIISNLENRVIGEITYGNWMTKATLSVNNRTTHCSYNNFWNTKCNLLNSEGVNINYSGSSTSGHIGSNVDDSLLILSGLFIANYYWERSTVIVITTFVPVWIALIH